MRFLKSDILWCAILGLLGVGCAFGPMGFSSAGKLVLLAILGLAVCVRPVSKPMFEAARTGVRVAVVGGAVWLLLVVLGFHSFALWGAAPVAAIVSGYCVFRAAPHEPRIVGIAVCWALLGLLLDAIPTFLILSDGGTRTGLAYGVWLAGVFGTAHAVWRQQKRRAARGAVTANAVM